jgi:alpha-L-fucosidase
MNLIITNKQRAPWLTLTACLLAATLHAQENEAAKSPHKHLKSEQESSYATPKYDPASPETMQWWEDAKFGLFLHWGTYSPAGGMWSKDNTFKTWAENAPGDRVPVKGYAEQIMRSAQIPISEYEKLPGAFDWSKFNAQDFINLCFASGQHYIVITSKHHDGFAMWRSKVSKWNIGDATPYGRQSGRDPLKELADACHATKTNGSPWEIKMCFYHSHCLDWYEPDGVSEGYKPHTDPTPEEFQKYFDRKVKPQVTELLTGYGDIGMLWFDVPRVLTEDQVQQLKDLVHKLSPHTIVDGRIGRDMGNYSNTGDNGTVGVPVAAPWETGSSITESYAYKINATEYKTPDEIILKLIQVVAHGGNYLLNIGPKGDGTIPDKDRQILTEVGKWTKANGDAIFGTRMTPFTGDRAFMPDWGEFTQKGGNLYLLVTHWPKDGKLSVPLVQNKIKTIHFVADADKKPLPYARSKDANGNDTIVISVPSASPQKVATAIAVECEGDKLVLAEFKHAYDAAKKEIRLDAANFQAYASNVKSLSLYYDGEQKAIVNWRASKSSMAVAWTFDAPEAGEYELTLDYALSKRLAGMSVEVLVDHQPQLTFTTEDTGGETVCKKISVGTVRLKAGKQEIAFDSTKSKVGKLFVMQQLKGVYLTKK